MQRTTLSSLPPTPLPAPGEVRVRLCWLRVPAGNDAPLAGFGDGAGVIDAVGDDVSPDRLGLPVWTWNGIGRSLVSPPYMTVPAPQAVPLPDGVPLDVGACLGSAALAAMHAVLADGGVAGKRVLVADGAGAVGHYAVQFARLAGAAQVVAAVGDAVEAGIALDAGAHATSIGGDTPAALAGVDRVIEADGAARLARGIELLRDGGDIVVHGNGDARDASLPLAAAARKNLRLRCFDVHALADGERRRALFELQAWLERNLIRHRIGARLPLARLDEARALARAGGGGGQVLLAID